MKPGDFIIVKYNAHSFPEGWAEGMHPYYYPKATPAIFLGKLNEGNGEPAGWGWGRVFWKIFTPEGGIQNINAVYCEVIS